MDERRDYFRIDLEASLELIVLPKVPSETSDPSLHFANNAILQVLSELKKLDADAAQLQQQIKESDRALGEYLHIMSRKIDVLAQYCVNTSEGGRRQRQALTISEGGIDFNHQQALAQHQWLAIMLYFDSPPMATALHAQVIRCEQTPQDQYHIAAEFRYENNAQRQQISQQIMRAQMESIRRKPKD